MISFIVEHKAAILAALLGISELMALSPSIKSSGIFDFFYKLLKDSQSK